MQHPAPRRTAVRLFALLAAVAALSAVSGCETVPAERALALAMTNRSRAGAGVAPVAPSAALDRTADAWAAVLRDRWVAGGCPLDARGYLAHSSLVAFHDPARALPGWSRLTENVGYATRGDNRTRDAAQLKLHGGYLASPGHRANLLDRRVTRAGTGVVWGPTDAQRAAAVRAGTGCARVPAGSYLWSVQAFIG